ncbi:MAG: hypothetical protein IPK80_19765 [Nannocystis sp.]|nr:hypothetical protein [Nannocystis sp.]
MDRDRRRRSCRGAVAVDVDENVDVRTIEDVGVACGAQGVADAERGELGEGEAEEHGGVGAEHGLVAGADAVEALVADDVGVAGDRVRPHEVAGFVAIGAGVDGVVAKVAHGMAPAGWVSGALWGGAGGEELGLGDVGE